jgi:hypothetical protein
MKVKGVGKNVVRQVYCRLPFPGMTRPTFIVGCGRSGTTILGTALSKHKAVTFLNEPRHLWFCAYPETDIWTHHRRYEGRLFLTEGDVDRKRSRRLSRLFRIETIISRRPVLIEKLPANCFRLNFVRKMFPDARFIHIYRNGLEVAASIERYSEKSAWFGLNSYKWSRLVDYAMHMVDTKDLPALCTTPFYKGLLEWRLSTEAAVKFLRDLPQQVFFEINYDTLVDRPVETVSKVLEFLGLEEDPRVTAFASNAIVRRSRRWEGGSVPEKMQRVGGKLLSLSLDGGRGLTQRAGRRGGCPADDVGRSDGLE